MSQTQPPSEGRGVVASLIRDAGLSRLEEAATTRYLRVAIVLILIGFLARLLVAIFFANVNPLTANTWEYGKIATASLAHGGIVGRITRPDGSNFYFPTAFMPPLSIFLWMGMFKIFGISRGALTAMIALNIAGGSAIVAYTIRIARLLFKSSLVALIAGAIMALHPVFVYSVATYEQLNLYILALLIVFDLSSSRFRPTVARAIIIGVVLAVAVLIRTEYLALGFAIIVGSAVGHRRFRLTVLSLVVAFFLVVPWTVRNYVVFHRFIPVADSLGYNLFKGFNPEANGSGDWVDRHRVAQKLLGPQLAKVPETRMYEVHKDNVYLAAAKKFMVDHPIRAFVILPVRKIFLFWFYDIYEPVTHLVLYQIQFWPLFFLSALGIGYAVKKQMFRDPDQRMLLIMFAMETLVMAVIAVHSRYRMNVEPFLFGYAALGALVIWSWLRSRVSLSAAGEQR